MKKLLTITDLEALEKSTIFPEVHIYRQAARAVVIDDVGKVALLYTSKGQFHKLPGGGVEEGEDLEIALERELLEEIGCRIKVDGEIGIIEEICVQIPMLQDSYCFRVSVVGEKGESDFTEREIAEGISVVWADSLDVAITLFQNDKPVVWEGNFIVMRDLAFLKTAKMNLI